MEGPIPTRKAAESLEAREGVAASGSARTEARVGVDSRVAKLVVELALFFIRENFVRFSGFFEFFSCCFVILILAMRPSLQKSEQTSYCCPE